MYCIGFNETCISNQVSNKKGNQELVMICDYCKNGPKWGEDIVIKKSRVVTFLVIWLTFRYERDI